MSRIKLIKFEVQKAIALIKKIKTLIDLFQREAAILIEDEEYIDTFVIDGNSDILKLMLCFVFNLLSSAPNLNNENILLYNYQKDHFWLFFEKFYETDNTIMYINSLKFFQTFNEKAYIWILLEFSQKNVDSIFEKICKTNKMKDFYHYKENIILTKYLREVIEIFGRLKKINYKVKLDICEDYTSFLRNKNLEKTTLIYQDHHAMSSSTILSPQTPMELYKKSSFDNHSKSSKFPFIHRKYSDQNLFEMKSRNNLFIKSTIFKRHTDSAIKPQRKITVLIKIFVLLFLHKTSFYVF